MSRIALKKTSALGKTEDQTTELERILAAHDGAVWTHEQPRPGRRPDHLHGRPDRGAFVVIVTGSAGGTIVGGTAGIRLPAEAALRFAEFILAALHPPRRREPVRLLKALFPTRPAPVEPPAEAHRTAMEAIHYCRIRSPRPVPSGDLATAALSALLRAPERIRQEFARALLPEPPPSPGQRPPPPPGRVSPLPTRG